MKKTILHILIGVSIAFNLAFAGTFIYHRFFCKMPPPPPDEPRFHGEMPTPVRAILKENWPKMKGLRADFDKDREDFLFQLESDNFNEKDALRVLEHSVLTHSKMEREKGLLMIRLRKELPRDEFRKAFHKFQKIQHRPIHRFKPRQEEQ